MTNKEWSLRKKIIVGILVAIIIFAIVIGVIYVAVYSNMGKVKVLPVSDIVYEDYDSEDYSLSGTISTGITQDITNEQGKVSEILVKEGDYVKKGTPVVRFDSASAQLELEQAKIDLQAKQVDLNDARAKLDMLNNAQSYVETIKVPITKKPKDESGEDSDTDTSSDDSKSGSADEETSSDSADEETSNDSGETTDDSTDNTSEEDANSEEEETTEGDEEDVEYQDVVVESDEPQFQTSDGEVYKESELRKEKSQTTSEIGSLEIDIKEAQATIESAQKEVENCTVTAALDGYVTKVSKTALQSDSQEDTEEEDSEEEDFDEESEEADESVVSTPDVEDDGIVVQISSLDGLFVNSAINEWRLQKYKVGDTVYVMDWESGNTYEATITMISPYVSESYSESYQYMGGSSESYYPFSAQITQDGTGLESGDYVDVSFVKPSESEMEDVSEDGTLSVMKAFVRSESGKKYVYVRGEDDLLHKQQVEVSGQSQESYTISKGLTYDDYIAFPYGKNIREGAQTVEGTLDELYE